MKIKNLTRWGVLLMPLIFPLYFVKLRVMGVPFTAPELLVYLLFAGWLLTGGLSKKFVQKLTKEKTVWFVLVFFVAAVISTLIVPEYKVNVDGDGFAALNASLGILKGWVIMPLLYMVMAYDFIRGDKEKKYLLLALMWSSVWLSLWALWQVLTGNYLTIDGRVSAFYESANYLALYLGPICVLWGLGFIEAFRSGDIRRKIYFLVPGLLAFAAMFFAASYAGWIAVFGGIFFYMMLSKKFTRKFKLSAIAGVLIVFALFGVSQIGSEKMQGFFEFQERSSTSARLQIWDASLSMIGDAPLMGIGLGQFQVNYQWKMDELYGMDTYEWLMPHPHNLILGIWLNFGLLGLISIIGILVVAFSKLKRSDELRLVVASMLFAVLVHGLFDMPFMKNDLAMQFWLLIALLL